MSRPFSRFAPLSISNHHQHNPLFFKHQTSFSSFFYLFESQMESVAQRPMSKDKHNPPPRRGQIKIKIVKSLMKSAAGFLSADDEPNTRKEKAHETPSGYDSGDNSYWIRAFVVCTVHYLLECVDQCLFLRCNNLFVIMCWDLIVTNFASFLIPCLVVIFSLFFLNS